ncbi:putative zinc-finger containing protein [Citrobacter phage CkP1]|nr:putative zinc-finger containing protein [Citrobacter phage CkP1]
MASGWGPSDDAFATIEATVSDGIEWARLTLKLAESKESEKYCEECDEEIPEARRLAIKGCTRCVACQSSHDDVVKSYYNRRGSKDSQLR